MDKSQFTPNATGRLVEISVGRRDWAFIPDPLPPAWKMSEKLWPLVADARDLLGRLDGVAHTLPNPQLLLHPLQSRESLTSSSLEGTSITAEELFLFELHDKDVEIGREGPANWQEVYNYREALRIGHNRLTEDFPLSKRVILEQHEVLMTGVRGRNKSPGEFRRAQVFIGSDHRYVPPPPNAVTPCLDSLEKYFHASNDNQPLVRCFLAHYQFEAIHPFLDGNGRVGRAFLSLMIASELGHKMPWLYMSPYFERYKREYFDFMFRVSTHGDWDSWIQFCLRGAITQATDAMLRCERLQELHNKYSNAIGARESNRLRRIIDRLFSSPLISVPEAKRFNDVSYMTAKKDIERLIGAGILKDLNRPQRPKVFFSSEIFHVAYADSIEETAPEDEDSESESGPQEP